MSASEASREDRHLPASERRLQQAREEGQLPRSRELAHLAALIGLVGLLGAGGPWLGRHALEIVSSGLRFDREAAFETARLAPRLGQLGLHGLEAIVPIALAFAAALVGAAISVGGWNFTLQALEPRFDRVNPLSGISRMLGWRHLLGHLRLMTMAAGLVGAGAWYVAQHAGDIELLAQVPLVQGLSDGMGWIIGGLTLLIGVCVLSALADVPLQIFNFRAELRMTHDEARQENKESDGDPHMKGERRRRARELSRGRMLADVPKASVIVTNPTHYAVALQYDEGSGGAPRVVAMGVDLLALKIREIGTASKVPVLEAPPLARALYRHGEVGREIPVELYTAVAQVLAWVYRLRSALRPPAEPVIEVPAGMDPKEQAA